MTHESGFWSKVLHKAFDDSEVTQAIVVVQETPLAFRLVQTFQRKKLRLSTPSIAEPPAATYRIDSTYATRELAIEHAKGLVARYMHNGWRTRRIDTAV